MANDRTYRLDDETVDALCASAEARTLLHPAGDVDTAVLRRGADALITGRGDGEILRRLDALIEGTPRLLPPGFPDLLIHMGIDPRAVLGLVLAIPESAIVILDDDLPVVRIDFTQSDMTWIRLSAHPGNPDHMGASWRDTELLIPAIPETVVATLSGRPLEDVVDHPALRPLGLTVVGVRTLWDDDSYMEVETSLHAARQEDEDVVTARVRAMLAEVTAGMDDVGAIKFRPISGTDATAVLHGMGPAQIGVNPELVRLHGDEDLRNLLLRLIDEWRKSR